MPKTFIDDLETIVDEVSAWGADIITTTVKALAPNGRGFGQEILTTDEKLDEYRKMRNDHDAWTTWIQTKAAQISNTLTNSGVGEDTLGAIDPIGIASAMALDYSSKMEAELEKRMI